jgi:hypothetical protein
MADHNGAFSARHIAGGVSRSIINNYQFQPGTNRLFLQSKKTSVNAGSTVVRANYNAHNRHHDEVLP